MNIDKKDRTQLKGYFVKNSIPKESEFAALIDGMLNQKEDGIAKASVEEPLSIQAVIDTPAGLKKVINFYENFQDANPTWMLQLNPRSKQDDSTTAKSGFSISDGQGASRLFIDINTGNIGIGTITPRAQLDINGEVKINGSVYTENSDIYFTNTAHNHSGIGNTAGYAALENARDFDALMILGRAGTDKGRKVKLWDYLQVNGGLEVTGVITPSAGNGVNNGIVFPLDPGGGGGDTAWIKYYSRNPSATDVPSKEQMTLEIGVANDANDHIALMSSGNVGIGTLTPNGKLDIANLIRFGFDEGGSGVKSISFARDPRDEGNAGKITYKGGFGSDALHIVGAGTSPRKIKLWDTVEVNGKITVSGEIQTTSANAFRMVQGNYGAFFRNDGSDTYLLLTNSGDQYGNWNDLRPLRINNNSGSVFLNNLDVAEGGGRHATIRAHDLWLGSTDRRGSPGRALVDDKDTLIVNYGSDWAKVSIQGTVTTPSSRKLKNNIQKLSSQTAKRIISGLEPVRFTYKADSLKLKCLGFIAEETPPEIATSNYDAIVINHIVAALTRVVKDQQNSISKLEKQINLLKTKNA